MAWSKIRKAPLTKSERKDTPDGLWQRCKTCNAINYQRDFEANHFVCSNCDHHYSIPALERIFFLLDKDSFKELDSQLSSTDPLSFVDNKPYKKRLSIAKEKAGNLDAFVSGEGTLLGRPVQIGVFDFKFMGGSMGSVVGEKIARVFLRAKEKKEAAIIFSSSGGARMQEGILSLMQMAKTCAALSQLRESGVPFISILTNPTTGGVAASYAMLGDINIAEPKALIGFAGPRVIQQTIGQSLPDGFQTSEYLLEHGMIDLICHRNDQREKIAELLSIIFQDK